MSGCTSPRSMARDAREDGGRGITESDELPHLVTVTGQGVPTSYEITVDGKIELVDGVPVDEATIVSGAAAESAIDTGVQQFRFSGTQVNVEIVDHDDSYPKKPLSPAVNVSYDV